MAFGVFFSNVNVFSYKKKKRIAIKLRKNENSIAIINL